ncbi:MAG: hypothetical protein ACK4ZS_00890 [Sulfurimicrobium sp.]
MPDERHEQDLQRADAEHQQVGTFAARAALQVAPVGKGTHRKTLLDQVSSSNLRNSGSPKSRVVCS